MKTCNTLSDRLLKLLYRILLIFLVIVIILCIKLFYDARSGTIQLLLSQIDEVAAQNASQELQLDNLEKDIQAAEQQLADLEESVTTLEIQAKFFDCIEDDIKNRIALEFSTYEYITTLDIIRIGNDTSESVKRLYLCRGDYNQVRFYIADYLTGRITDLSKWSASAYISHIGKDKAGVNISVPIEYQIVIQDLDADNVEDILFIMPFKNEFNKADIRIDIWLQRNGEFMPVNSNHCGIYNNFGKENKFSLKISNFNEKLKSDDYIDTDYVVNWIKNELFSENLGLLEELLRNPADELHYTQLRQPTDLKVTVTQNANNEYRVSIPQNPYSENEINTWLENFYEEEAQRTYSFMGYGERDSETMTPEERERMGFYRSTSLSLKRADDAIISFFGGTYEYSGGVHGNGYYFGVNFDPRSGKYLTLEDIFINDYIYTGELHRYIMEYIDENFSEYGWGQEHIRDALTGGGWCLTGYGFKIFLAGGNGGGEYEYDIPYELFVGYLKTDYFPTDRSAEYLVYFSSSADNGAKMDINADGILDIITGEEKGDTLELNINGRISNLTFKNGEETFSPHNGYFYLIRDKEGAAKLEARLDYYREVSEKEYIKYNVIFVYNIIDEQPVWVETHIYPEEQY